MVTAEVLPLGPSRAEARPLRCVRERGGAQQADRPPQPSTREELERLCAESRAKHKAA